MLSCCKKRETDGLYRRWGLRLNYTNQSCFLIIIQFVLTISKCHYLHTEAASTCYLGFIHSWKYPYNIISHECQAIYKGTEVISTINDMRKPYVIINLKYLFSNQKYTCVDLLTKSNWSIYNSKCMKVLVHLMKYHGKSIIRHTSISLYILLWIKWLKTSCSNLFLWFYLCGGCMQVCYIQLLVLCNISHLSLEHMYTYRSVVEVWHFDVNVIH